MSVLPIDRGGDLRAGDVVPAARVWPVRLWLWLTIALVFAMIIVGGATRLTDSGLSITEWLPILGAIPPLSAADWDVAFEKYRQIPEYREINRGMSMADFQFIYWWEWGHRLLGRLIGVVFAIPLFVFLWQGRIPNKLKGWLVLLLGLGALQGFVGWYMVQSGLVDRVDVSQYRLALHLSIAFVIFGLLIWCVLQLDEAPASIDLNTLAPSALLAATLIVVLVYAQVALGAFVAGLKAGLTYNTWPLMDGEFLPSGLFAMTPWWANIFENITTVQFNHRMTAYLVVLLAIWHVVSVARTSDNQRVVTSAWLVATAIVVQAILGIWTLLSVEGAIPIGLGLVHQGGAAVVAGIAIWHWHRMRQMISQARTER